MSITLNNATIRIDITPSSGFTGNGLIFDSSENHWRVTVGEVTVCSSSSLSIGKNNDNGSESNNGDENDEVQSSYKRFVGYDERARGSFTCEKRKKKKNAMSGKQHQLQWQLVCLRNWVHSKPKLPNTLPDTQAPGSSRTKASLSFTM
ncbi:hypothetical protein FF1_032426 [Malus domestica]